MMQMLIFVLLCLYYSMESRSTTYCKKKKARGKLAPNSPPLTFYHTEVVNKCYINKAVLFKAHAYVLQMKFNDEDRVAIVVMRIPCMVYHLRLHEDILFDEAARVFQAQAYPDRCTEGASVPHVNLRRWHLQDHRK